MEVIKNPEVLSVWRKKILNKNTFYTHTVSLCGGTGCQAGSCGTVISAFKKELARNKLEKKVRLRVTGCHGFCEQGPLMIIEPDNIFYCRLSPGDVPEILTQTIKNHKIIERLCYTDPSTQKKCPVESKIPFYAQQSRILIDRNKNTDPSDIEDYIAENGYAALCKSLKMQANDIIQEILKSGLRGRGGGGYPTGKKWQQTAAAAGEKKYIICNADEGDPGAYMDRSILEGNPHSVIEGMMIGAKAIGADEGIIYVRNEYPLAVLHAGIALEQCRNAGLLGKNILGSGFSFDIRIVRGAGAFVSGESSALIASISGKVGEPSPKDVHLSEKGLEQNPTNMNNVETWANIPLIIENGAMWFASRGTERSKGTKIFALTGKIKNTGLVEVAMGTSLKKIIYDIGGGSISGTVKAVQTGGPSGGCLPASKFDLPVDFEALSEAGSMVGSGGMVVMDENTCMVDVARYFLDFLIDESCGKCVPCRIGLSRIREIICRITEGKAEMQDLELLEEISQTVSEASLCALGKTAPNPVLSTIRYFREEYISHIHDKKCPAKVCKSLIKFSISPEICTGCGACKRECPAGAISGEKKQIHNIDQSICTKCGICRETCRLSAISLN
ncbi:MAG: NADH dehydrogenase [Spirochaetes bacterium GWF1_41_5]|nr:MAG: NADH dehydrogenase [Spirochaetes bacterium GWF1_41_5]HBE03215.1 NADH-quinone oxidoreductase subunit F [Spirochaetia bacterium]